MKLKQHIKQLNLSKEEKLSRVLFLIQQNTREIEEKLLKKYEMGITRRELIYIVFLKDCEGMNMMDICDVMALSKGAFSKAIKALVQKGYVIKTRCKTDTRISTLSLTPQGKKAYEIYVEARKSIHEEIIGKIFNDEERKYLYLIADKFVESEE